MKRLWDKGESVDSDVLAFTVGDDPELDQRLLLYDIVGSFAHLEAIHQAGVIDEAARDKLHGALHEAISAVEQGTLIVTPELEDGHTALEAFLTDRAGEAGKMIHTGRSRNDQALTMLRLFFKDALTQLSLKALELAGALVKSAESGRQVVIPGYTHHRQAMPSTWGLWAAAQAEGILESIGFTDGAYAMADRSPLGSGAGYGVPLPLDREAEALKMGFGAVQINVISCQASRGKDAVALLSAATMFALDLSRLATDLIAFSDEVSGFLDIPETFTTGSSIMPHKRNPDVLELLRAQAASVSAGLHQVISTVSGLPSGYHRNLQTIKGPCLRALDLLMEELSLCTRLIPGLKVDGLRARACMKPGLHATEEVFKRVRGGLPFRDAYREVALEVKAGAEFSLGDPADLLEARSSLGAPGNLGLERFKQKIEELRTLWETRAASWKRLRAQL